MPKVTFLNLNQTVEAKLGETLLEVAQNHDVPIQHACGGFCACTTCHVIVQSGSNHLSAMEEDEQDRLEVAASGLTPNSRLGCQAKVQGDVVVQVVNLE